MLGVHSSRDATGDYQQFTYLVQCTDGDRRVVLRFYEGSVSKDSPVWVSCSCPDFLYRWEVALAARNNSSVIYSNGAYPKQTNPQMTPGVCKHVLRGAMMALQGRTPENKRTEPAFIKRVVNRLPRSIQELVGSHETRDRRENRERK
jgi:hypothetical protein